MKKFLETVAAGYAAKIMSRPDVAAYTYCFVFPNKRAGTFFLKYFRNCVKGSVAAMFAPRVSTITDFTEELSGRIVESRINLIFLLYKCYCSILSPEATPADRERMLSFDAFRRWGETVLGDFNEVDMHSAETEEMFKNVADFKKLTSTFLTPEQRDVIEEYFGYRALNYDDEKFWLDFNADLPENAANGDGSDVDDAGDGKEGNRGISSESRKKFVRLWKVLYPLYMKFSAEMALKGVATAGLSYRLAAERLERIYEGEEDLQDSTLAGISKIVMVGFNALSGSERRIFDILQGMESPILEGESICDFVWDATGPVICRSANTAGHFVRKNIRMFPAPAWLMPFLQQSDAGDSMPEIVSVSSPSKVMQVKIAAELISELKNTIGDEAFSDARVAMVLPDESLLLPMLYSIPENIEDANLTMGYPLKLTSVNSFLTLLRRLQLMRRDSSQYKGFSYQEVSDLLSHPYAQGIIGPARIKRFRKEFESRHRSVVRDYELEALFGKSGARLLTPLPLDSSPGEVIAYLDSVLDYVGRVLDEKRGNLRGVHNSVESHHIIAWREALRRYGDAIEEYGIKMGVASVLAEAYRLLQGELVPFEGEPLKGLQIMGLLETRALDFDHIFVVSVNDKVIPQRSRRRSFLPNLIRRGYGLPPVNYSENIFSYYFYRLISRAKKVTLIYDGRSSGLSGGVSRYLMQLKYLHARRNLKELEYRFNPKTTVSELNTVEKTPEVMKRLDRYLLPAAKGEKHLKNYSVSLLKRYLECTLKFYFYGVMDLNDDPAPSEGVNNIEYGDVIHKTMEMLYVPASETDNRGWLTEPVDITADKIDSILADEEGLYKIIRRWLNFYHYKEETDLDRELQPDTEVVARAALLQVKRLLEHDRTLTPFKIYGCEVKEELIYTTASGRKLNLTYAIDRVDDAECEGNPLTVRVVDYKTGAPHAKVKSFNSLFSGSYEVEHLFQLLFYSLMMNEKRVIDGKRPLTVKPVIYPVAKIFIPKERRKGIPVLGETIMDYVEPIEDRKNSGEGASEEIPGIMTEFKRRLDAVFDEIYDEEIPFSGEYSAPRCAWCPFSSICK